jgi:Flp pilus assembly protein TadG
MRGSGRGQALVEFALIVSLFVLVVVGIFEGGRAIYTYNALSNAVNEALREAIVHQNDAAIEAEADRVLGGLANDTTFIHDKSDCTPVKSLCSYRVELRYVFSPVLIGDIFSPVIAADGEMPVETKNP